MRGRARQRGAEVFFDPATYDTRVIRGFLANPDPEVWRAELRRRRKLARWSTAAVYVDGSVPPYTRGIADAAKNLQLFDRTVVDPAEETLCREGNDRGYAVKWTVVGCPSKGHAKEAGMTLDAYTNHFYASTIGCDFVAMRQEMRRIKRIFDKAKWVRIVVPGKTDIRFSIAGRGGEVSDGRFNMPDGEVAYGPVENSANGYIYFPIPTNYEGHGTIEGIRLDFKNGVVTNASATKNEKGLHAMLGVDFGAKRLGEFGIGCNPGITDPVGDILFDEKIIGTVHLALGDSYRHQPLTCGGGKNKSAIHQDLICALRRSRGYPGGRIYVDNRLVNEQGTWRF